MLIDQAENDAAWKAHMAEYNRRRNLPHQLERARARVRQLEAEAARFGMHDLVADPIPTINDQWDRETMLAYGVLLERAA